MNTFDTTEQAHAARAAHDIAAQLHPFRARDAAGLRGREPPRAREVDRAVVPGEIEVPHGLEAGIEVLPNLSPYVGGTPGVPRPPCPSPWLIARTGWYISDLACPIGPHTGRSVLRSAHTAVAAADAVLDSGESAAFLSAVDRGIAAVGDFDAGALVLPLGFDTYKDDPISVLALDLDAYGEEGGYLVEAIGAALDHFLQGFLSVR